MRREGKEQGGEEEGDKGEDGEKGGSRTTVWRSESSYVSTYAPWGRWKTTRREEEVRRGRFE